MEKFIYYNELYLIYKDLLNKQTSEIFNLYYGENLSMQEIADIKSISKARVGVIIKNAEKNLEIYENSLHNYKTNQELNNILELSNIDDMKNRIENILRGE